MKRIILVALIGATMTGCAKQAPQTNAYEEFKALLQQTEEQFDALESEEEAQALFGSFTQKSIEFIAKNAESGDAYRIAQELLYMLDTDEKAQVFSYLNPDSLEAYGLESAYQSFLAEKNTCVGCVYTDFETIQADGTPVRVSELLATHPYVLIDFWASWCRPCREMMPFLKGLYEQQDGRLEILGVSLDDDRKKWLGAIEALELNWRHGSDLQGWDDPNAALYGVTGIPCTLLIRASDGLILARGEHDIEKLAALIDE